MEYKRLGNSGLKISRIGLGCMSYGTSTWQSWVLDEDQSIELISAAYDAGINFFDTANIYSNGESERVLGNALKKLNIPRKNVVIATKVYGQVFEPTDAFNAQKAFAPDSSDNVLQRGLSRKHIFEAVEASLNRLQTDYIDLYQIHRFDPETPIEETMQALNDLVRAGKVRYIGASSMWAYQFAKANHIAEKNGWTKFTSMQNLYNLLYREEEREMNPYCSDAGIGLIPWSPLAAGALARLEDNTVRSTYTSSMPMHGATDADVDKQIRERVKQIAEKRSVPMSQIALAWVLTKPGVTAPIIGVSKKSHLDDAIAAVKLKLDQEEIKFLEELYQPKRISGHM